MILRRVGNKEKIAPLLLKYFPPHDIYVEPFFGAGGMFFNKPKAKYNILNDKDEEVYNLFRQFIDNSEELIELWKLFPVTQKQFKEWARGKQETTPVMRALWFLVLSNMSLYGKNDTLRITNGDLKQYLLNDVKRTLYYLNDVLFTNLDYKTLLTTNFTSNQKDNLRVFCYCDPPYMNTTNNYQNSFTKEDTIALFDTLHTLPYNWAVSEFKNDFLVDLAKQRGYHLIEVCNRQTIKNKNTEVLICNYSPPTLLFT